MLRADGGGMVSAAGQVDGAAGALRDIDVPSPFTAASDALPGSQVAQSCLWVSTRLAAAIQVYGEDLRSLATATRGTAADLDRTDRSAAASMSAGVPR